MSFPTTSGTLAQAQLQEARPRALEASLAQTHSRELGAVVSESPNHGAQIARKELPVAKSWAHFVAGGYETPIFHSNTADRLSLGGITSAVLTAPLDVLKTRLQSDFYRNQIAASRTARGIPSLGTLSLSRSAVLHFRETFQILLSVHQVEGWRALFKGLGPNLVGVVPAKAISFYAYGNGKRIISENFNQGREAAWVHLSAATSAGIITSTVTNPIWLIKTRLQLDKSNAGKQGHASSRLYKNSIDCLYQTVRKEGIGGLYRGLSASFLGVSELTLQWVLYEQMKLYIKKRESLAIASGRQLSTWDKILAWSAKVGAAGGAKTLAAAVTYPHEVVRTRLRQAPLGNGPLKYTGLMQCFRTIWKEEGMASFYGGLTPHLLRTVPSAAIMFGMLVQYSSSFRGLFLTTSRYELILPLFGTHA
jgi:solute carrier family 25 protein 33/36